MKLRYLLIPVIVIIIVAGFMARSYYRNIKAAREVRETVQAEDIKVTLLEGWTTQEMGEALEKNGLGTAADFIAAADKRPSGYPLLATNPTNQNLEGFLFPDTYRFAKGEPPADIIQTMLDNFNTRVQPVVPLGSLAAIKIPGFEKISDFNFYQVMILASIIERESNGDANNEERRTVAGIFYNRLQIGQALEADSTVNYITKKNSPSASGTDISIDSPYNTYKYKGLPPGPISNPSLASIKAALSPIDTDYFYFFHDKSGQVYYSKTFEEHRDKKLKFLNKE